MNKMITQATKNMALFAVCQLILRTSLSAEMIGPGDRVVVIRESSVRVEKETVAVVNKGAELTADRVNGHWIWVSVLQRGKEVWGWLSSQNVVKRDPRLKFSGLDEKPLGANQYRFWTLPTGVPYVFQLDSSRPVDVFVFTEEGKAAYEWAVNHSSGQATSKLRRLAIRNAKVRWDPPDRQQYYLFVDNTNFPDGGALGNQATETTVVFWLDNLEPPQPIAGRGLIIGRVTMTFDGYKNRYESLHVPLTACIAHCADGEDDEHHRTLEVLTDDFGYFALGNLPRERRYWVKEIKGRNFTAPVPLHFNRTIGSVGKDDDSAVEVLDVGHIALSANADGKMGVKVTSPGLVASRSAGDSHTSVSFSPNVELKRHEWFVQTFPSNGWVPKVRRDQARRERESEEAVRKNASALAPAPPGDDA